MRDMRDEKYFSNMNRCIVSMKYLQYIFLFLESIVLVWMNF